MLNFFVILLNMTCSGTSIATTVRPRFQTPLVSLHFRGTIAQKTSQTFVENFLNYYEFLGLHNVRNLDFL